MYVNCLPVVVMVDFASFLLQVHCKGLGATSLYYVALSLFSFDIKWLCRMCECVLMNEIK